MYQMDLTPKQRESIEVRDANVLVSAAAGSGKTSVLVKRVIERISDIKDPADIDRLLIMTFTNAAAAEMQSRIRDAIDERLAGQRSLPDPDPEEISNLERQSILVGNAMITTIHGFCKRVITDHFEQVSIDPSFRVADENESKLLKLDALDETLERMYEQADPAFLKAVDCFSSAKNDSGFADLIIPLYEFVMSDPDPEGFIDRCCRYYRIGSCEEFLRSDLMERFYELLGRRLESIRENAEKALEIINDHEELLPYKDTIDAYKSAASAMEEIAESHVDDTYDDIREALLSFSAPAFGRVMNKGLDDDTIRTKDEVKHLRDSMDACVKELSGDMSFDLHTTYVNLTSSSEQLKGLTDTVRIFAKVYDEMKRDKNIIDFNDMEHMAVTILKNPLIADGYRQQYEEVYVDEYQDSNMTQETLVSLICRHDPGNVFQVGDVKQSIYRFRHARPDLFLSKFNTYMDGDSDNRRILLNENFRSRPQVIDAVNEVFSKIMKADTGGIEYDESAMLCYGAHYYDKCTDEKSDYKTELVIGINEDLSTEEFEADLIAGRIISMIDSGYMIYDKKMQKLRPVSYGDFVILTRSIKNIEPVFREVFASAKIPLGVTGREGYFGTTEVKTVLSFLACVDNPHNDIPITALMRSPAGGFNDKELATITAFAGNKLSMYDRIRMASQTDDKTAVPEELRDKCMAFLELLRRYKEMSHYSPVHTLLYDFLDREYMDHVRCMSRSGQRIANLSMLLSIAEDYGRTSFKGLYQFNRYIDQIRKYNIDSGEAGTVSEGDDVVRMMTMHASKGLEFPVCFIAGLEKGLNRSDESGKIIRNAKYGFGADFTDLDKRITGTTLPKIIVREENRLEAIAEEMRVLYVAMTRARDKLIMVGCAKEDYLEGPGSGALGARSFLDLIKTAKGPEGFRHIDCSYVTEKDLTETRLDKEIRMKASKEELVRYASGLLDAQKSADRSQSDESPVPEYMKMAGMTYQFPLNPDLKAKLSVSELKHKAIEEKIASGESLIDEGEQLFKETMPDNYIPKFMRQEGQTKTGGTFYGTAFHRIMELWNYNKYTCYITPDMISEFAENMHNSHRMDKDQVNAVRPDDVCTFLNSSLGQRMAHACTDGKLFREQPFVIGVPQDNETVLVQGIIDAYFVEDDGITIVDYKTDHVTDEEMLINRYRTQLEYYGMALSQITGHPVKALTIWSTCLGREIIIA